MQPVPSASGAPMPAFVQVFIAVWVLMFLTIIVGSIFWVIALVDCVRREFPGANDKIVWVLVVILGHLIGALVYWFIGRPKGVIKA